MSKEFRLGRLRVTVAGVLLGVLAPACRAGDLAAVVSSNSGPYSEAYAAFSEVIDEPVDFYDVSGGKVSLGGNVRHVAAFGVRAAAIEYPPGTRLVYALAPVVRRGRERYEISMVPRPEEVIKAYKGLQPGLKRLAVFWSVYPGEGYIDTLRGAADRSGVEVISVRLKSPDSLPERLRLLMGKMDAFWLMPDPVLITKSSLMVLADFSCANSIPFYAPTHALVQGGATASFSPDFFRYGAAAARAITLLRQGRDIPLVIFADSPELRVNEALRTKCGWPITGK